MPKPSKQTFRMRTTHPHRNAGSCKSFTKPAWRNGSEPDECSPSNADCSTSYCATLISTPAPDIYVFHGSVNNLSEESRWALHPACSRSRLFRWLFTIIDGKEPLCYSVLAKLLGAITCTLIDTVHWKELSYFNVHLVLWVAALIRSAFKKSGNQILSISSSPPSQFQVWHSRGGWSRVLFVKRKRTTHRNVFNPIMMHSNIVERLQ